MIHAEPFVERDLLGFYHEEYEDKLRYRVHDDFLNATKPEELRLFFRAVLSGRYA